MHFNHQNNNFFFRHTYFATIYIYRIDPEIVANRRNLLKNKISSSDLINEAGAYMVAGWLYPKVVTFAQT